MSIKYKVLFCMVGLPITISVGALLSDNPTVHRAIVIGSLILLGWWAVTLKCPKCGKDLFLGWRTNSSHCPSCRANYLKSN
jgi:hypothetical protein